jgi:hypothetical protein
MIISIRSAMSFLCDTLEKVREVSATHAEYLFLPAAVLRAHYTACSALNACFTTSATVSLLIPRRLQ